jgi:6-phosphogluconolactonase
MAHSSLVWCVIAGLACSAIASAADAPTAGKQWVYVGTTTTNKNPGKGIYRFDFDPATGQLTSGNVAAEAVNPSFLAIHPTGKYLFAVGEVAKSPVVNSFRIDPKTGMLTLINQKPSGGPGPCHVTVDKAGKNVFVANYAGGSAAVLQADDKGELTGPTCFVQHAGKVLNTMRQDRPHAHSVNLDAANKFAMIADLGLDQVKVYKIDAAAGTITPNDPPAFQTAPGAGPRHFAFHQDGKRAFVINELNSTLTALDYDAARGVLTERQTVSTLPPGYDKPGNTCAEVVVHPSGKFVYGSNRGHNSIAAFAIEPDGKLRSVGYQGEGVKTPRNFNIDPSGQWLLVANQDGGSIVVFKIDQQTGALSPTGIRAEVPSPMCIKFWPAPRS